MKTHKRFEKIVILKTDIYYTINKEIERDGEDIINELREDIIKRQIINKY